MDIFKFMKTRVSRLSLRSLSIQQRLPLLICVLLLFIIVAFSWTSYIGVKRAAVSMGQERLRSLTGQLSTLFGQSAQTFLAASHATAGQEAIKKYLQTDGKDSAAASLEALQKLRLDSTWIIAELLNSKRTPVLRSIKPGTKTPNVDSALSISAAPLDSSRLGKIYLVNDSMYYPIVVAVTDKKQIIGYLIRWRLLQATPKAIAQFSQLIGTNASLYIGNADGSLWTDMIRPVSIPKLDTAHGAGFFEYAQPQGETVMAAVQPIPNSHWLVLVEFSQKTVLEAANRFLRWIIIAGAVLIAIGMVGAWVMSRNITKPLGKLMAAASAIAGGDYSSSVEVNRGDELGKLARAFNVMTARVHNAQQSLERKVQQRTAQLETVNKELEAFSHSVSHDLRAPLRAINGYATILQEDYGAKLDLEGNRITGRIISNTKMMGQLIDDLIHFAQMGAKEIVENKVDMNNLADACMSELLLHEPSNKYQVHINPLCPCRGDQNLLKQVWMNLIGNALKYSSKEPAPYIEIGCEEGNSMHTYFIRDNGVGFDMQYAHKLFGVFQRLHSPKTFEGNGIGLAFAKRIISKHKGEIRAEAILGQGATFYFSLPKATNYEQ